MEIEIVAYIWKSGNLQGPSERENQLKNKLDIHT